MKNKVPMENERFVLVFDFETSGLPKNSWIDYEIQPAYKNGMMFGQSNEKDYPYAIQLSYILYDNVLNWNIGLDGEKLVSAFMCSKHNNDIFGFRFHFLDKRDVEPLC